MKECTISLAFCYRRPSYVGSSSLATSLHGRRLKEKGESGRTRSPPSTSHEVSRPISLPLPFRTPATQAIWPQDEPANIYTVYEPSQRKKTPERPTAWVLFQLSPGMDQTPISIPQRMTSCECLRTSHLEASYSRLLFCRSIDDDENNTKKSCHSWLKLTLAP